MLGRHSEFAVLKGLVKYGMDNIRFKKEIKEEERLKELQEMVARGSHKSAKEMSEEVIKLLTKEVTHAFSILFSPRILEELKH